MKTVLLSFIEIESCWFDIVNETFSLENISGKKLFLNEFTHDLFELNANISTIPDAGIYDLLILL